MKAAYSYFFILFGMDYFLKSKFLYEWNINDYQFYTRYGWIYLCMASLLPISMGFLYKKYSHIQWEHVKRLAYFILILNFFSDLLMLRSLHCPLILADEFEYWHHAATLSGIDWSQVTYRNMWYACGYSFILLPIVTFCENTVLMYRTAVFVNIIMLNLTYIILKKWIASYYSNPIIVNILPLICILYPSYNIQINLTWPETLITFIFSICLYLSALIHMKPKYSNLIAFAAANGMLFITHNRTIGIVIASFMYIIYLYNRDIVSRKLFFAFFSSLSFFLVVERLLKYYISNMEMMNSYYKERALQRAIEIVTTNFSLEGIGTLLHVFGTQLFSVSISTGLLIIFSTYIIISRKNQKYASFYYLHTAFFFTLLISSVWFVDFVGLTHLLYTRYFDPLVGPILMLGILYTCENSIKRNIIFIVVCSIMMCGLIAYNNIFLGNLDNTINKVDNTICLPITSVFYALFQNKYYQYIIVPIFMWITLLIVKSLIRKQKNIILMLCVLCPYFLLMRYTAARNIVEGENTLMGIENMAEEINSTSGECYLPTKQGLDVVRGLYVQYAVKKKTIQFYGDGNEQDYNSLMIIDRHQWPGNYFTPIIGYFQRMNTALISPNVTQNVLEIPLSIMEINKNQLKFGSIYSGPDSRVCNGPYITLNSGRYCLHIDFDIYNNSHDMKLGDVAIVDSKLNVIEKQQIIDNEIKITFFLNSKTDNVQFVISLDNPEVNSMIIHNIKIEKIGEHKR